MTEVVLNTNLKFIVGGLSLVQKGMLLNALLEENNRVDDEIVKPIFDYIYALQLELQAKKKRMKDIGAKGLASRKKKSMCQNIHNSDMVNHTETYELFTEVQSEPKSEPKLTPRLYEDVDDKTLVAENTVTEESSVSPTEETSLEKLKREQELKRDDSIWTETEQAFLHKAEAMSCLDTPLSDHAHALLNQPSLERKETKENNKYNNYNNLFSGIEGGKGEKGGIIHTLGEHMTDMLKKKPLKKEKFVVPSKTEVADFITQENLQVDAGTFVDFYDSRGWCVGRSKIKNWQATARLWHRRALKEAQAQPQEDENYWHELNRKFKPEPQGTFLSLMRQSDEGEQHD